MLLIVGVVQLRSVLSLCSSKVAGYIVGFWYVSVEFLGALTCYLHAILILQ